MISKKLRFEVFKRDSFTCQYCGRQAPDVTLEADHINPKSKGGNHSILNLITSCFDCNRGKGSKKLSDNTVLKKKHKQLKELQEKRAQIEMMIKWENELIDFNKELNIQVYEIIEQRLGCVLSDYGMANIDRIIVQFGHSLVIKAIGVAEATYLKFDSKNKPTETSFSKAINKLGGICYNIKYEKHIENKHLTKI